MFAVRPLLAAATRAVGRTSTTTIQTRSFSILPRLRPTTSLSSSSVFRSHITAQPASASLSPDVATAGVADVVSQAAISRHPAFAGVASQVRCGPRPTMAGATRLVQKRRHGFLSRVRTKGGRKTLARRRTKGRKRLSA